MATHITIKVVPLGLSLMFPFSALAASHIDFNGHYTAMYISEHNIGNFSDPRNSADNYFGHWFELNIDFQPTDEISLHWRVRAPEFVRWGRGLNNDGSMTPETKFIYGRIVQDWGTISVGRLSDAADNYGLANLGYMPVSPDFGWSLLGAFDGWDFIDALEYRRDWENGFGIMAQYARLNNYGSGYDALSSDFDHDRFVLEPRFKWEKGGASLGLIYDRDASPDGRDAEGFKQPGALDKTEVLYLAPAFMHNIGNFSIHAEAKLGWGQMDYYRSPRPDRKDADCEGYGFYLDFGYNYGPGNLTLHGWWLSGTGLEEYYKADGQSKSLVDMGGEFYPLIIAHNLNSVSWNRLAAEQGVNTNAAALANNAFQHYVLPNRATVLSGGNSADIPGVINPGSPSQSVGLIQNERWESFNNNTEANHWALMLSGSHNLTEEVSLRFAAAYLGLNKPNYRVLDSYRITGGGSGGGNLAYDSVGYQSQSKEMGFEIDVAVTFQLLDNLILSSTFGYMFTGEAYQSLKGYEIGPADNQGNKKARAVWEDADDSYGWYNTLTFLF